MRFSLIKGEIKHSGMRKHGDKLYWAESFDNDAVKSEYEPRGPYLIYDGNSIKTDIFGQIPLFIGESRVENRIFEGGIQHDPLEEIIVEDHSLSFHKRDLLQHVNVKDPVEELSRLFSESVRIRAEDRAGVLLSGGVDSSAIATVLSKEGYEFMGICISDGVDAEYAEKLSKRLGFELISVHLDMEEVEGAIPEIYSILGMKEYTNSTPVYLPVITSLSITFYFAMREAWRNGIKAVFSGIGSEELFAGFRDWTGEPMEKQVLERSYTIYKRDLWRDYAIAEDFGIKMKYPFLDRIFAERALSIPVDLKVKDGVKKWIWRKSAQRLGVPEENAWRKNKAAQYGSGADKILEKLAKNSGKKYRMRYLMDILMGE